MRDPARWQMRWFSGQAARLALVMAVAPLVGSCIQVISAVPAAIVTAPFGVLIYGGIAACEIAKERPPTTTSVEQNISVRVDRAVFRVERMGVTRRSGSDACFVALDVTTENVPVRLGNRANLASTPKEHEALWSRIDSAYFSAAKKFAELDVYGCKVGRIAVRGPKLVEGNARLEGSTDNIVDAEGRLGQVPRSDC